MSHVTVRPRSNDLPPTDWRERPTVSVEQAGVLIGVSRGLAYEAVRSGEIPSIRVGKRLLVPVAALRRLLGEKSDATGDTAAPQRQAVESGHDGSYQRA